MIKTFTEIQKDQKEIGTYDLYFPNSYGGGGYKSATITLSIWENNPNKKNSTRIPMRKPLGKYRVNLSDKELLKVQIATLESVTEKLNELKTHILHPPLPTRITSDSAYSKLENWLELIG